MPTTGASPDPEPVHHATIVLCRPDGAVLGALPPLPHGPWWPETAEVVTAIRVAYGIDVVMLRVLAFGADTSYEATSAVLLAETSDPLTFALAPWPAGTTGLAVPAVVAGPLVQSWARPGGPADHLAWAREQLAALDRSLNGRPRQIRTWNLSTLWQLPTTRGLVWLKVVPDFFAHEGAVLELLQPSGVVPPLLARDGPRTLLAHVPGEDQYRTTLPIQLDMVRLLVELQHSCSSRVPELLASGIPDRRRPALTTALHQIVHRRSDDLNDSDNRSLKAFFDGIEQRWSDIESCGIPDTLVHGDFHPGNLRRTGGELVLLDWGDSAVAHPVLDQSVFLAWPAEEDRPVICAEWAAAWQRFIPGADANRAATLLEPIGALRQASIHQMFMDHIDPAERPYHAADPVHWLRVAVSVLEQGAAAPKID